METNPHKVFQESVTMTARMWPQVNSSSSGGGGGGGGGVGEVGWGWRVPPHHWPLLVAMFCGGALVILLVLAAVLWHWCVAPHRNKDYRVKMEDETLPRGSVIPVLPSHSAVFVERKCEKTKYSSRLVASQHWLYNKQLMSAHCGVPRSISVPATPLTIVTRRKSSPSRVIFHDPDPRTLPYPHISEFSPGTHYLSSSILDESGPSDFFPSVGSVLMKTQSLPACVRSKPRPISTSDDPSELYAKVNFSKKRRNRMRNDEAAIIALSRSRSQFLHKDTDSLVDNEAVIVYDERTAL